MKWVLGVLDCKIATRGCLDPHASALRTYILQSDTEPNHCQTHLVGFANQF